MDFPSAIDAFPTMVVLSAFIGFLAFGNWVQTVYKYWGTEEHKEDRRDGYSYLKGLTWLRLIEGGYASVGGLLFGYVVATISLNFG